MYEKEDAWWVKGQRWPFPKFVMLSATKHFRLADQETRKGLPYISKWMTSGEYEILR